MFFGNEYGDYKVPTGILHKESVIYSFGLGEDASFDVELSVHFDCIVNIFDPTPKSYLYYEKYLKEFDKLKFYQFGIWSYDCQIKFYEPTNKNHVSHSITNLQNTDGYFIGDVMRISSIMKLLLHDEIDLIKLDIEGAEYAVLQDMIESKIKPKIICVEFHNEISEIIQKIINYGYKVFNSNNNVYTFIL